MTPLTFLLASTIYFSVLIKHSFFLVQKYKHKSRSSEECSCLMKVDGDHMLSSSETKNDKKKHNSINHESQHISTKAS